MLISRDRSIVCSIDCILLFNYIAIVQLMKHLSKTLSRHILYKTVVKVVNSENYI